MASFAVEDATVEDKCSALQQWWQRHCKSFSEWYLSLDEDQQRAIIKKACPDMQEQSAFSRQHINPSLVQASDVILPEFSLEGMLASKGRIFTLFMTRRLTPIDLCMKEDIRMLTDLFLRKALPSFSNNALEKMDTPFIDPMDPEENIRSLSEQTSVDARKMVEEYLVSGRLIHAEVWISLKIRRAAIVGLMENMVVEHQREVKVKPSPTYAALLVAELQQQAALLDAEAGEDEEETSNDNTGNNNNTATNIPTKST